MNEQERIAAARAEINAAINRTSMKYDLPPHITELILNSALSDVRAQVNILSTIEHNRESRKEVQNKNDRETEASN